LESSQRLSPFRDDWLQVEKCKHFDRRPKSQAWNPHLLLHKVNVFSALGHQSPQ